MRPSEPQLVNGADVIVLEKLNLRAMTQSAKGNYRNRADAEKAGEPSSPDLGEP